MTTKNRLHLSFLVGIGTEALIWLAAVSLKTAEEDDPFWSVLSYGHYLVIVVADHLHKIHPSPDPLGDLILMIVLNAVFISLLVFAILSVVGKLRGRRLVKS